MAKTYYICTECRATVDTASSEIDQWLIDTTFFSNNELVIRCPRHINYDALCLLSEPAYQRYKNKTKRVHA